MYIQLRIVGIRMEVDIMSVDFVGKVANVQKVYRYRYQILDITVS